jgi:hypothetical protein
MESASTPSNIRFVAYANEEPPHFLNETMGSRIHARSCRKNGNQIQGMICLESLGYYSDEPGSQQLATLYGMPDVMLAYIRSRGVDPTIGNFLAIVGDDQSESLMNAFDARFTPGSPCPRCHSSCRR